MESSMSRVPLANGHACLGQPGAVEHEIGYYMDHLI